MRGAIRGRLFAFAIHRFSTPDAALRPLLRTLATLLVALAGLALGGCSMPSLLITPVSSSSELEEQVVARGRDRGDKIALIEVEGMLSNTRAGTGGLLGAEENKVSLFKQQLDAAASDGDVKAVILRINSPGGTVPASDAMYALVRDFKARTGKPVVAAAQTVCASGGYYVACAADEVHATPTSVVGSIGVIFQAIDLSGLMDKVGVQIRPITSGPLKDLGSPFDGLSAAEQQVMQGIINEYYSRFTGIVLQAREIRDEEKAFDGRVFTGQQAYEIGLVDRVYQLPETIARTRQIIGSSASVVLYKRPYGYTGSIYAHSADLTPRAAGEMSQAPLANQIPLVSELSEVVRPGFYYLWMP